MLIQPRYKLVATPEGIFLDDVLLHKCALNTLPERTLRHLLCATELHATMTNKDWELPAPHGFNDTAKLAMINIHLALANPGALIKYPGQPRNCIGEFATSPQYMCSGDDVVVPPGLHEKLNNIASKFNDKRTGRELVVTSGTRTYAERAHEMYEKIDLNAKDTATLYGVNPKEYQEIKAAYDLGKEKGESQQAIENKMAGIIENQVGENRIISYHLIGRAVDFRTRGLSQKVIGNLADIARQEGAKRVKDEGNHLHVQF